MPDLFSLSPSSQKNLGLTAFDSTGVNIQEQFIDIPAVINNLDSTDSFGRYVAILNHNLKTEHEQFGMDYSQDNFEGINLRWAYKSSANEFFTESTARMGAEGVLNYDSNLSFPILHDGSSIVRFDSSSENFNPSENAFYRIAFYKGEEHNFENFSLGGLSLGIYYDLRTPDLDVELTTEFDGFSSTKTLGGSTLTNIRYSGSPHWSDFNGNKTQPFSVNKENINKVTGKRNGRRVWSLKFSYMADTDIFASNYTSSDYYEHSSSDSTDSVYEDAGDLGDSSEAKPFRYTLEEDNSFMAQVINRIGNGQRFIFQPDKNNNNPDQFAICMLDMDEFSVKQVAYRTYSFDLKIREVW